MGDSAAGSHFGGDPDRFHHLLLTGPLLQRKRGMAADAIRTLSDVCHGDGDQLFGFFRKGAIGEHAFTERVKSRIGVGGKFLLLQVDLP